MLNNSRREFVHQQNIDHSKKRLSTETDLAKRDLLLKLLAEEKAGKLSLPSTSSRALIDVWEFEPRHDNYVRGGRFYTNTLLSQICI